jgi:hypothetical protein
MTKILAIDPGTSKSGWCYMEKGIPVEWGWTANEEMYALINKFQVPLVIEDIVNFGMPSGKDVFTTVRWTGRFDRHAEASALPCTYITRTEVKLAVCESPRANDSTIRQGLIDRYGGDEKAIGGKKCQTCKGKGWTGREHTLCQDCHCTVDVFNNLHPGDTVSDRGCGYQTHPGVLHGISGHVWSALAVGVTYLDTHK